MAHAAHARSAMTLFLCLAVAKAYASLYVANERCFDDDDDDDGGRRPSRCGTMRWVNVGVVGAHGYLTYVAMLVYQRLTHHYAHAAAPAAAAAAAEGGKRAPLETAIGADAETATGDAPSPIDTHVIADDDDDAKGWWSRAMRMRWSARGG